MSLKWYFTWKKLFKNKFRAIYTYIAKVLKIFILKIFILKRDYDVDVIKKRSLWLGYILECLIINEEYVVVYVAI